MIDYRNQDTLADTAEINALLARYVHSMNRANPEVIKSCYHPDSIEEHGPYKGTGAEFVDAPRELVVQSVLHVLGIPHFVSLDRSLACTETGFVCTMYVKFAAAEPPVFVEAYGRFLDRLERRGGGPWLIAHRRVVIDHSRETAQGQPWRAEQHYLRGLRTKDDPVYYW